MAVLTGQNFVDNDLRVNAMPYHPKLLHKAASPLLKVYKPLRLDEFRVLELLDRDDESALLHCTLCHEKFPHRGDQVSAYSAVSYTWNEKERLWYGRYPTFSKPVVIDEMAVHVSDKVANMLCLLLQRGKTRVWIDALCINQQDTDEKNRQVARMSNIYREADEVIIVLGSPTKYTDAFYATLLKNSHLFSDSSAKLQKYDRKFLLTATRGEMDMQGNSYWSRAWVLQEITLAQRLLLLQGNQVLPFQTVKAYLTRVNMRFFMDNISNARAWKFTKWELGRIFLKSVLRPLLQNEVRSYGNVLSSVLEKDVKNNGIPFALLLGITRHWNGCANPRDFLYARLGLASALLPHPDYSLSIKEVFVSFASKAILSSGSLEILVFANKTNSKIGLPTWVPDWTSKARSWYIGKGSPYIPNQVTIAISEMTWSLPGDLPSISGDGHELSVVGRKVTTLDASTTWTFFPYGGQRRSRVVDHDLMLSRWFTKYRHAYPLSEAPRPGDLVVILKGLEQLVFIRPQCDYHQVVGRNRLWSSWLDNHSHLFVLSKNLPEPFNYTSANVCKMLEQFEEVVFKIR